MADLTEAELAKIEARYEEWRHAQGAPSFLSWKHVSVTEELCEDVPTLLAEVRRLRALLDAGGPDA